MQIRLPHSLVLVCFRLRPRMWSCFALASLSCNTLVSSFADYWDLPWRFYVLGMCVCVLHRWLRRFIDSWSAMDWKWMLFHMVVFFALWAAVGYCMRLVKICLLQWISDSLKKIVSKKHYHVYHHVIGLQYNTARCILEEDFLLSSCCISRSKVRKRIFFSDGCNF